MKIFKVLLPIVCSIFIALSATGPVLLSQTSCTVSGKVIGEDTGKGIEGVQVKLYYGFRNSRAEFSDKNGDFAFMEIPTGRIAFVFYPPKPYAFPDELVRPERYDLQRGKYFHILKKMKIAGTLSGRVFEEQSGLPINGSDIKLWLIPGPHRFFNKISDGNYIIDQLLPGTYKLRVMVNGFGLREIMDINIKKGQTTSLDLSFDKSSPTKITGKVTCLVAGVPPKGSLVSLSNKIFWLDTTVNDDGGYTFFDVKPGEYEININGVDDNEEDFNKAYADYEKQVIVVEGRITVVDFKVNCNFRYR